MALRIPNAIDMHVHFDPDSIGGTLAPLKMGGVTAVEERELWHMPALMIALVAIICTEWGLRRYWRLA